MEIKALNNKKAEYRSKISLLNDEKKSLTGVLANSEQNKQDEVKIMEQRIESRVAKIIIQKE